MVVNDNSRFKGAYIFLDETRDKEQGGRTYLSLFRDNYYDSKLGDLQIVFEAGMRIDLLAYDYYGDETLDWVIMDANPKYNSPFEISVGDLVVIPHPNRVMLNE